MNVIEQLANKLNKKTNEVAKFLFYAPRKYRVYNIPKRTHGYRTIAQPSEQLKHYQRAFLALHQSQLPIHDSAMAYKKNLSIKDNAQVHSQQRYLLKMDLENFFNSITPELFWQTWQQFNVLPPPNEQEWLEKLLFWDKANKAGEKLVPIEKLVLSIGAPSSPLISNFCLYPLDEHMTAYCAEKNIYYTRYADDLTFSSNKENVLFDLPAAIQEQLTRRFGQKLLINQRKTVFSSKAHNRHVTGITITNEGHLSLGRERKRYIKHLVHQYKYDRLAADKITHLQGLLSFANHIESAFILGLKNKYSEALIQQINEEKNDKTK